MNVPDIIIAIDGYSSTGKSSFAKLIAKELSFTYLDSGALYRAVTLLAQEAGIVDADNNIDENRLEEALQEMDIHFRATPDGSKTFVGERCVESEIRSLKVSNSVSPVATLPIVRGFVDRKLREFGRNKRFVMDGRDIGTTVFPEAELKIFMTATAEVRARRRWNEMVAKGQSPDFEEVVKNIKERDYIDSHRETSPLVQAPDAVVLDNSDMTFDEQMAWFKTLLHERFGC